ncbi:MAG TPA: HD domain-containing phosphohydrolase [Chloroflexota bacterium]|jgi:HD-GYP domain-containing protein (c-di-GMP phosphodiesterase class II)
MALDIQLRFTPDLAAAVDAAGLAAYGVDAAPMALRDMATADGGGARGRGREQCVHFISCGAVSEGARGSVAALKRLAAACTARRGRPAAVILAGDSPQAASLQRHATCHTAEVPPAGPLAALARAALETARLRVELAASRRAVTASRAALQQREATLEEIQRVGIALSAERDADTLQQLILTKSRELTCADAGSLYLVETVADTGERHLRFQWAQNDSVSIGYAHRATMPLSPESMAGYVAITGNALNLGDVSNLPPAVPYHVNRAFDEQTGYRTRSMLLVPMINRDGDIVGVIQLINRKRYWQARLDSLAAINREVIPFDAADDQLLRSFASQAAVALDNQQLLESIQRLYDGFVRASVQAIESRDPTTSGHSQRVATLSVALAEATHASRVERLAEVAFTPAELRELRYAAVLHDFGKVGVREHVLIKAKKLYPWQLQSLEERFATARALLVAHHRGEDLDLALRLGPDEFRAVQADREARLAAALADLERDLAVIRQCSEPTVLEEDRREQLAAVGTRRFHDVDGTARPLLDAGEMEMLTIPRGNLTDGERREIESHVTHTVRFLSLIPWTKDLRNIALIAGAHHEKLNGRGYPNALTADGIPVQSRIMTIADIYDALTGRERPYKRAVPVDAALGILRKEAEAGMVDTPLLDLFVNEGVYEAVVPPREEEEAALAAAR